MTSPGLRMSNLSSASNDLERPRNFKTLLWPRGLCWGGNKFQFQLLTQNMSPIDLLQESQTSFIKLWVASSDLGPLRPPYMMLKWHLLVSGCKIWPRPLMTSSDLGFSKRSYSLEAFVEVASTFNFSSSHKIWAKSAYSQNLKNCYILEVKTRPFFCLHLFCQLNLKIHV